MPLLGRAAMLLNFDIVPGGRRRTRRLAHARAFARAAVDPRIPAWHALGCDQRRARVLRAVRGRAARHAGFRGLSGTAQQSLPWTQK